MNLHVTAHSMKFDEDEGRIILVVDTDEGDTVTINIHSLAVGFYHDVRRELGPWAHEADSARAAVAAGVSREDYLGSPQPVTRRPVSVEDAIDAGYALDDPKSPGYHDRMVG